MTSKHRLEKISKLVKAKEQIHHDEKIRAEVAKRILAAFWPGGTGVLDRSGNWTPEHEQILQEVNEQCRRNGYG